LQLFQDFLDFISGAASGGALIILGREHSSLTANRWPPTAFPGWHTTTTVGNVSETAREALY